MGLLVLDKLNHGTVRVFHESDVSCPAFHWAWFTGYNASRSFDGIASRINIINPNRDMAVCVAFLIVRHAPVVGQLNDRTLDSSP